MARTVCEKYANVQPPKDFDWDLYEDGWNGVGLRVNKRVKTKDGAKVYCHEAYAQSDYPRYFQRGQMDFDPNESKDLAPGAVVKIKDVTLSGDNELIITTSAGGSAIVNLSKENRFFEMFEGGKDNPDFRRSIFRDDESRIEFLNEGFLAKIERGGKASLYDGYLAKQQQEFKEQLALGPKATAAYKGTIVGVNRGGYIMDVRGIRCFLPGGQVSASFGRDAETVVGTELEVMILKYVEGRGFLVSRKMYLQRIQQGKIDELRDEFEREPDKVYHGTVTGASHFGVFVELNEFYTGLLHKTYIAEEDYEKLRGTETDRDGNARANFPAGTPMDVKIYSISEKGIVLTNILDPKLLAEVVERRTKEKEAEDQRRQEEEKVQRRLAEQRGRKLQTTKANKAFKGETISLEDLKRM